MPRKPYRRSAHQRPGSRPAPATSEPATSAPGPAAAPARRGRRWRRIAAIALGLVVTGSLAAVVWSEFHPAELARAEAAYGRNHLGTALRIADGYLARRPSNRHAALLAARCLSRLGRPDEAEEFYRKAAPLDVDDLHIRAYALVLANRREPAIRAYREILDRRPDDVLALSRMAGVLISESRWVETFEAAKRLIEIPDGAVIGHTLAGVVHHNTRDPELAVFAFDRVIALDPALERMPLKPRSMFWNEYGHNLLEVGRWVEARKCLEKALADGNDPKAADLLGQSYFLAGQMDEAERCWRLALQWDADRYGTWWRLGKLDLQRGRVAEAIESLRRATVIEPRALGPLYSLSLAYRRLGRPEEAERCIQEAKRIRGKSTATVQGGTSGSVLGADGLAP
jgi:tetratricopeptide (TPR) repeat protein